MSRKLADVSTLMQVPSEADESGKMGHAGHRLLVFSRE